MSVICQWLQTNYTKIESIKYKWTWQVPGLNTPQLDDGQLLHLGGHEGDDDEDYDDDDNDDNDDDDHNDLLGGGHHPLDLLLLCDSHHAEEALKVYILLNFVAALHCNFIKFV